MSWWKVFMWCKAVQMMYLHRGVMMRMGEKHKTEGIFSQCYFGFFLGFIKKKLLSLSPIFPIFTLLTAFLV